MHSNFQNTAQWTVFILKKTFCMIFKMCFLSMMQFTPLKWRISTCPSPGSRKNNLCLDRWKRCSGTVTIECWLCAICYFACCFLICLLVSLQQRETFWFICGDVNACCWVFYVHSQSFDLLVANVHLITVHRAVNEHRTTNHKLERTTTGSCFKSTTLNHYHTRGS